MSDTESFEHAMDYANAMLADCDIPLLDLLQEAHNRELEQVRTEVATRYELTHCPTCEARLKSLDMQCEIEHLRKAEYARGYHDGQHSMDAEHYAVVLRLKHLPLDGGSQENLNQIAGAVWYSDFGWTQGACKALRDELVRLMGGVHEPSSFAKSGYFGKLGDDGHGEIDKDCQIHQTTTQYDVLGNERHKAVCELKKIQTDAGGFVKALANALGVEWQAPRVVQTIAEVRDRLIHLLGGDEHAKPLIETLVKDTEELSRQGKVRFPPNKDGSLDGLKTVEETAALIDKVKRRADKSHESSPMRLENETGITDELRKWASDRHCKGISHTDALNVGIIADHIEEQFKRICWQQEAVLQSTIEQMTDENLTVKDERDYLRRQMDQQRAMLTEQCDEARAKVLKLESENAEWRRGAERDADKLESLTGAYNDAVAERDELRAKLEEANSAIANYKGAIANYREHMKSLDESERLREKLQDELKELQDKLKELEDFDPDIAIAAYGDDNDELRRLLYRAAKLLVNAEQDRDSNYAYWMDCKEKVVQKSVTIDELSKELEDARDALNEATGKWARADEERRELQDRLDAIREAVDAVQ